MSFSKRVREVLITELKFLSFRRVKPDLKRLGNDYLILGIVAAWLAGVGRYWDNPRAELWQTMGLGSIAYIFLLALILWLLVKPLCPDNWSYKSVLIFVGMTSPPAILYAIPVERYFTLGTAQTINVWFLAIVASWRVILLLQYLVRGANLGRFVAFVAALLPLAIIVSSLAILNLERVVFRIMGGMTESERTANDAAYFVLLYITYFSFFAAPVLLLIYIILIVIRRKKIKRV